MVLGLEDSGNEDTLTYQKGVFRAVWAFNFFSNAVYSCLGLDEWHPDRVCNTMSKQIFPLGDSLTSLLRVDVPPCADTNLAPSLGPPSSKNARQIILIHDILGLPRCPLLIHVSLDKLLLILGEDEFSSPAASTAIGS